MKKTTPEQFNEFKYEVARQLRIWGLVSWETFTEHKKLGDDVVSELSADVLARNAYFKLNTKWDDDADTYFSVDESALHEVLELLLWKLRTMVPEHLSERATEETHAIIQTIINVVRGKL